VSGKRSGEVARNGSERGPRSALSRRALLSTLVACEGRGRRRGEACESKSSRRPTVAGLRRFSDLSGVLAYGAGREEAIRKAKALALRVLADRLEHGEQISELLNVLR